MPQTAGQAMIWIAIASIVTLISVNAYHTRTTRRMTEMFYDSMQDSQKVFREESAECRKSNQEVIDRICLSNERAMEKHSTALSEHGRMLERSVEKITSRLDDIGRPRTRKQEP